MKYLKILGLAALSAMALMAFGAGSASATTLEETGVTKNSSVSIVATIAAGTSAILEDDFFSTINTSKKSEVAGSTESPFTGTTVTGKITTLTFGECENSVTVHKGGTLHIEHIKNTTNGTVTSPGAEVTTDGPFGYLNCKTEAGTHLCTLTGVLHGHATMHINAKIKCGSIPAIWTGPYTVTSPTGLGVSK